MTEYVVPRRGAHSFAGAASRSARLVRRPPGALDLRASLAREPLHASLAPNAHESGDAADHCRALIALAITSAAITSEIADCRNIAAFAHRESGSVSVGLKAVEFVNAR